MAADPSIHAVRMGLISCNGASARRDPAPDRRSRWTSQFCLIDVELHEDYVPARATLEPAEVQVEPEMRRGHAHV